VTGLTVGRTVETPSATAHELADLARAGYRVLHEPSMQVEFEIHHLVDRPGGLAGIVARDPAGHGFAETLSSGANGVGLVVGTRIADMPGQAYRQADASVRLDDGGDDHATFRGSERPNLTFQHESSQLIDGVIAIEDEPKRMLLRHGLVVLDTLRHVAETALHAAEAPLLSLQCPAQLPPTTPSRSPPTWAAGGWTGAIGLDRDPVPDRAGPAAGGRPPPDRGPDRPPLRGPRPRVLARRHRPGYGPATGSWSIRTTASWPGPGTGATHDLHRAGMRRRLPARRVRRPARPGTTHAILSFLGRYPQIGVLGCSMTRWTSWRS
jgi:hypothetical protein